MLLYLMRFQLLRNLLHPFSLLCQLLYAVGFFIQLPADGLAYFTGLGIHTHTHTHIAHICLITLKYMSQTPPHTFVSGSCNSIN